MQNIEMINWNIEEDEIKKFTYPIIDLELAGFTVFIRKVGFLQ